MEIDVQRWTKLVDEIAALSAQNSGYNLALADLERRRDALRISLLSVEGPRSQRPRPPTLIGQPAPLPQGSDPMGAVAEEARLQQLEETRRERERADAELRHKDEQAKAAFARWSRLRHLENACRKWASEHDVSLPGEAGGGRRAIMQPSPPAPRFTPAEGHATAAPPPTSGSTGPGAFGWLRGMRQ